MLALRTLILRIGKGLVSFYRYSFDGNKEQANQIDEKIAFKNIKELQWKFLHLILQIANNHENYISMDNHLHEEDDIFIYTKLHEGRMVDTVKSHQFAFKMRMLLHLPCSYSDLSSSSSRIFITGSCLLEHNRWNGEEYTHQCFYPWWFQYH